MKANKIIVLFILIFALAASSTSCDKILHQHSYGEWTETKAATCISTGVLTRECSCGEKETSEIPVTDHKEVTDSAVAATCAETGLTEGKHCSVCEKVLVAQETVALKEHKSTNGVCTECGTVTDPFLATISYVRANGIRQDDAYMIMDVVTIDGAVCTPAIATHASMNFLGFVFYTNIDGIKVTVSIAVYNIGTTYAVTFEATDGNESFTFTGTIVASEVTKSNCKIYDLKCDPATEVDGAEETMASFIKLTLEYTGKILDGKADLNVTLADFGFTGFEY